MRDYTVDEILEGLQRHDKDVLTYIYKSFYQQIKYLIIRNSGTEEDAQDIYQEALIVLYRKKVEKNLEIQNCSFNTYLYSVCRLLWLKQLEKKKLTVEEFVEEEKLVSVDEDIIEVYERSDRFKIFQKHFSRLKEDCQKVLKLAMNKTTLKDIAVIMGYKSEKYAKKRKYQCKETLVTLIKKDPQFNEFHYE